jgi:hypothetical protein
VTRPVQEPDRDAPTVCAVLGPGQAALGTQTRRPDETAARLPEALASGSDWLWLLDGSVVPRPGALAALLDGAARARDLEQPAVLTGVVLDARGEVDESWPLWYRRNQVDLAMAASGRRLLPVRAAAGSVLVRRTAALAERPPASLDAAAVLEWTARILRSGSGYLVPESEADAVPGVRDPAARPRTAARLLFGGALVGPDRLRYGFELAERARARSEHG